MEIINKLKLSLEEKSPSLLLGAGFSYGATNENGEEIPLGQKLVKLLYNNMFIDNPPVREILEEDDPGAKKYLEQGDLKGLCSLLRDEDRVKERNTYLTSVFRGATINSKSNRNYSGHPM